MYGSTIIWLEYVGGSFGSKNSLILSSADKIKEFYDAKLPPTYSSQMIVEPYTTYTKDQLTGCQGP